MNASLAQTTNTDSPPFPTRQLQPSPGDDDRSKITTEQTFVQWRTRRESCWQWRRHLPRLSKEINYLKEINKNSDNKLGVACIDLLAIPNNVSSLCRPTSIYWGGTTDTWSTNNVTEWFIKYRHEEHHSSGGNHLKEKFESQKSVTRWMDKQCSLGEAEALCGNNLQGDLFNSSALSRPFTSPPPPRYILKCRLVQ